MKMKMKKKQFITLMKQNLTLVKSFKYFYQNKVGMKPENRG
jgi:hypothetical protein